MRMVEHIEGRRSNKAEKIARIVKQAAENALGREIEVGYPRFPDFYSPERWRERGEEFGRNAELIIVHDGGDYAPLLNLGYCCYELFDKMIEEMDKTEYWTEQCTCWYTAVYKD